MKVLFAGTPDFAIPSLKALCDFHEVCAVYTKPDSPSGRGLKLSESPVKKYVRDHYPHLPILQPVNLKDADTQRQISEFYADVMVVIAYGLILPRSLFSLFKYGCLNVHASLLPRWRGAAPIQRALLAGDTHTGVTIMQIDEGLDTGNMLHTADYIIQPHDTAADLHKNLAELGTKALLETLADIETYRSHQKIQDNQGATYAAKISKDEAMINWHKSAEYIARQVRAFNPWPVAFTYLGDQLVKIWQAQVISAETISWLPGQIIATEEEGVDVATKQGVLRLLTLQMPGGKPMSARDFLNARRHLMTPLQTFLGEKNADHFRS